MLLDFLSRIDGLAAVLINKADVVDNEILFSIHSNCKIPLPRAHVFRRYRISSKPHLSQPCSFMDFALVFTVHRRIESKQKTSFALYREGSSSSLIFSVGGSSSPHLQKLHRDVLKALFSS